MCDLPLLLMRQHFRVWRVILLEETLTDRTQSVNTHKCLGVLYFDICFSLLLLEIHFLVYFDFSAFVSFSFLPANQSKKKKKKAAAAFLCVTILLFSAQ